MQVPACAALLLLAGLSSGQILVSVKRLAEPAAPLPQLPESAQAAAPFSAALDYKQQVEQRNQECYQQCDAEFVTAEGSANACRRGCRLFALSEAIKPKLDISEHRDKCSKDCEAAYTVLVEQHSCQSGCQHQRPKAQDGAGAPVLMSVVRQFSFDSTGDQEVRRSQSSLLVQDGDAVRVIRGPTKLTVSRHAGGLEEGSPLDGMMARMRDAVHRMMASFSGSGQQPPLQLTPQLKSAPGQTRHAAPSHTAVDMGGHVEDMGGHVEDMGGHAEEVGRPAARASWHRVWRCTPHYVVLGALLLATSMVLYGVYCMLAVMLRARRQQQALLIQNEEFAEADDLPPKYAVAVDAEAEVGKSGDVPPAYTAIVAEHEPPAKPQV